MIRSLTAIILVFLLTHIPVTACAADETADSPINPDQITGIWLIEEDGETVEKIEIYKRDGLYFGTIIWIRPSDSTGDPAVDKKNKTKELRNRPLLGLEVMKGFAFDGKETWRDGKVYAHRKGKTVSPKLTLVDEDHLKIQVKLLFVKKSFVWQRDSS